MMKMISKIAKATLGLVLIGSSVFAQSLADAKKAIDAEQYQKAKGMLKNLTNTKPNEAENFFQLGWVYLLQDYADSAKATFTKGVSVDPKFALNYVGLGVVSHLNKDESAAAASFNQAIAATGKKDSKTYLYIGKGYLIGAVDGKLPAAAANTALDALNKGKAANPKDAEIMLAIGDAYRSQIKSSEAFTAYNESLALDPKSAAAHTAQGVLITYAENYEAADKHFQDAIAIDPNYGPAYRAWAESNLRQAQSNLKVASAKVKEGVEHYKKYISLTDQSDESLLRYADFLVNAGDWAALQETATQLSKSAGVNARVYRYLAIAAYENKDYPAGISAMNNWFQKADAKRILPRDYLYLGRLQIASGQDSVGVNTLYKAVELDSTYSDVYPEIGAQYIAKKKYGKASEAYEKYTQKSSKSTLSDWFKVGQYAYFGFSTEDAKAQKDRSIKADSSLLIRADSAFSHILQKVQNADAYLFRARIAEYKDSDRNAVKGLAKPYYEKFIELTVAKGGTPDARTKTNLIESYNYLGAYNAYTLKDDVKAEEFFNKVKELDPADKQAAYYFQQKGAKKTK